MFEVGQWFEGKDEFLMSYDEQACNKTECCGFT